MFRQGMKTFKQFLISFALTIAVVMSIALPAMVSAQAPSTPPASTTLVPLAGDVNSGASSATNPYSNLPQVTGNSAEQKFYNLVLGIILNVRYILGAVAVGFLVYAGIQMVLAQGNEEVYTTQRRNITYAIIGLALVGLSGELVRIFSVYCPATGVDANGLPCTPGGFLNGPNAIVRTATLFDQRTQFVTTFIKYLVGSIAVLMIIRSALRLITSAGNEEKLAEDKKSLFYGILGLLFIIMADSAINNVFYKVDLSRYPSVGGAAPGFNANQGINEVAGITNLILEIAFPIAVLMLIYGAFLYVTSAGNEEQQGKAKRLIFTVVIGILIMYAAFAIVGTVISGSFQPGGAGTVSTPAGQ